MRPSRNTKEATPASNTRPAIRKAPTKECVRSDDEAGDDRRHDAHHVVGEIHHAAHGADSPRRGNQRSAATRRPARLSRARPRRWRSTPTRRWDGMWPSHPAPRDPGTCRSRNTALRTRVSSRPLRIRKSISQPPTSRSRSRTTGPRDGGETGGGEDAAVHRPHEIVGQPGQEEVEAVAVGSRTRSRGPRPCACSAGRRASPQAVPTAALRAPRHRRRGIAAPRASAWGVGSDRGTSSRTPGSR